MIESQVIINVRERSLQNYRTKYTKLRIVQLDISRKVLIYY